ncbi:MAG: HindIII family type II restriction endonuclease [Gemmatimonadota bacterium]|nr:HindIII family type II restriction endonuclease [Gemmatimonadota bacterium]
MRSEATERRSHWVAKLENLSGSFGDDSTKMFEELQEDIRQDEEALLDHLRLCGAIPEQYGHDSSEEKLYSKYTDAVLSEALSAMGLNSKVLDARGDAADVQARASAYSLVADAKAFRLSRTAKNQKDFKVQAMDGWRRGLDYAVVVCPIYQLPARTSQIYQQAIKRNVCVLSYSHLGALVSLAMRTEPARSEKGLNEILKSVSILHPSKNSVDYWTGINRALVSSLGSDIDLWKTEKIASQESLAIVKEESIQYLTAERDRLLSLSHQEALNELVEMAGSNSRIQKVERIKHGSLLGVE